MWDIGKIETLNKLRLLIFTIATCILVYLIFRFIINSIIFTFVVGNVQLVPVERP